jgi:ATP-dependent Clp protease ATP-binding subunit ClpA
LTSTNFIRFDMSEFNKEHANQRLVGAPPGYVGYDVGGELTNAVKQNPFSLILFDEIEKAHPILMDIFLQILDDGRLTSGRGETVYFSDALIVFTSNLGVYQLNRDGSRSPRINPGMEYSEVRKEITDAITEFFTETLNRPEILNRLGPNIVVFDFIKHPYAEQIFEKMLDNALTKLRDSRKITIRPLESDDKKLLIELACRDLSMGGRGIGNALEQAFVNPLARALFEAEAKAEESYSCRLSQDPDGQLRLSLNKIAG